MGIYRGMERFGIALKENTVCMLRPDIEESPTLYLQFFIHLENMRLTGENINPYLDFIYTFMDCQVFCHGHGDGFVVINVV